MILASLVDAKVLEERPARLWTLLAQSEQALERGAFPEAARSLEAALEGSRGAPWVRLLRYRLRRLLGRRGWMRDLDTAFRADPRCAWVFGLEPAPAGVAVPARNLIERWSLFAATARIAPVLAYRGQARVFRGQAEKGLDDLDRAAALEPAGWILAWRGEALRRAGDAARAEDSLTRAIALDSRYANARSWRASIRLSQGRFPEALADLDRALRLAPTARTWMERSRLHRAIGDLRKALDDLDQAARLNPELTWGSADRAGLIASEKDIRRQLELHPRESRLRLWLADTLLRLRRPGDALQALKGGRDRRGVSAFGASLRAQAELETGASAAAERWLRRAFALDAGNARAHWVGACLRIRKGEPEPALAHLNAALRRWKFGARLYQARADLLQSMGRPAAAAADRRRCLRLCPGFRAEDSFAAGSSYQWP